VGRRMMQAVIERGAAMKGMRLLQDSFNTTSLSLYASMGFDAKEPIAVMSGQIKNARPIEGVRPITESDLPACEKLHVNVHGITRTTELADAIKMLHPML